MIADAVAALFAAGRELISMAGDLSDKHSDKAKAKAIVESLDELPALRRDQAGHLVGLGDKYRREARALMAEADAQDDASATPPAVLKRDVELRRKVLAGIAAQLSQEERAAFRASGDL